MRSEHITEAVKILLIRKSRKSEDLEDPTTIKVKFKAKVTWTTKKLHIICLQKYWTADHTSGLPMTDCRVRIAMLITPF